MMLGCRRPLRGPRRGLPRFSSAGENVQVLVPMFMLNFNIHGYYAFHGTVCSFRQVCLWMVCSGELPCQPPASTSFIEQVRNELDALMRQ